MEPLIEKEAAEALLDRGVSVPFKDIRIPWRKKPMTIRMTMRRPTLSAQIDIARLYLDMGATADAVEKMSKPRQMEFLVANGKTLSRIIALTVCRGYLSRHLTAGMTAWFIRNFVEYKYQIVAVRVFESLMGTDPFLPIIRSAERTNPMKPRLSQRMTGS